MLVSALITVFAVSSKLKIVAEFVVLLSWLSETALWSIVMVIIEAMPKFVGVWMFGFEAHVFLLVRVLVVEGWCLVLCLLLWVVGWRVRIVVFSSGVF